MKQLLWAFSAIVVLSASAYAADSISADFINAKGEKIGTATLGALNDGTLITVDVNLPKGAHAMHIHEKATCDAPDFKTAGGHFGMEKGKHSFTGDLLNLHVESTGHIKQEIFAPQLHLQGKNGLLYGTSIVIHERGDDFGVSSANAGGRIACAVIRHE